MADLSLNYDPDLLGTPAYGDLKMVNGDLVLTNDVDQNGTDSTLQSVCQRLRLYLGEWFMNTSAGVPWYQQILVKNANPSHIDGLLRDCILGTPGVVALLAYSSTANHAQRSFHVTFTIQTAAGGRLTATVPVAAKVGAV